MLVQPIRSLLECPVRLASLLVAVLLVVPVHGQEGKPQENKPTGPKPRQSGDRAAHG